MRCLLKLPTVTILMLLLIGTGTSTSCHNIMDLINKLYIIIGRTRPYKCRSSSSSDYYSTPDPNSNDWQCGDNYCIERYYVCDGVLDCFNGRDELNYCGECC
jgi:hypothetical protein